MDVTESSDTQRLVERAKQTVFSIYSLILLIVLWEGIAQLGVVHYHFLPPLSDVIELFVEMTISGEMVHHTWLTLYRAMTGLVIAVALGVPIGVLAGRSQLFDWFWSPVIAVMYPVPAITLIPVFMLWFGFGDQSRIFLVAWACFWPIALNARDAARSVDENLIWSARMMGTSTPGILRRVIIPGASPGILTGIQIALPVSFIAAFIFEMVAGGGGLGHLQYQGARRFVAPQVFAAIVAIMIVGLGADRLLRRARGWLLRWE